MCLNGLGDISKLKEFGLHYFNLLEMYGLCEIGLDMGAKYFNYPMRRDVRETVERSCHVSMYNMY